MLTQGPLSKECAGLGTRRPAAYVPAGEEYTFSDGCATFEIFKQADFKNRERENLVSRSFLKLFWEMIWSCF